MEEMIDLTDLLVPFQDTMWLPQLDVPYLVMAAALANRLPGDPLWLLIIGPPSSGKTEALSSLSDLPEYHAVSTLTEPGLLIGSPVRDGSSATGGLLMQVGERGLMVASDFGTLLHEHGSTRNRIFACLREIYDGKFVRRLGTNGGQTYAWEGHAGFIGACTEAIDSPSLDLGLLGERFSYCRVPASTPGDDYMACVVADEHAGEVAAAVQPAPPAPCRPERPGHFHRGDGATPGQGRLDGMHPGRRAVIDYLMDHPGIHATATIAGHCRLTVTPLVATCRTSTPMASWISMANSPNGGVPRRGFGRIGGRSQGPDVVR